MSNDRLGVETGCDLLILQTSRGKPLFGWR